MWPVQVADNNISKQKKLYSLPEQHNFSRMGWLTLISLSSLFASFSRSCEPPMYVSLSPSPCTTRNGHSMVGINCLIFSKASPNTMANLSLTPLCSIRGSVRYASTLERKHKVWGTGWLDWVRTRDEASGCY